MEYEQDLENFQAIGMPIKFLGHSTLQPLVIRTTDQENDNSTSQPISNRNTTARPRSQVFQPSQGPRSVGLAAVSSDSSDSSFADTYTAKNRNVEKARESLPADFQDRICLNSSDISRSRENICHENYRKGSDSGTSSSENINGYSNEEDVTSPSVRNKPPALSASESDEDEQDLQYNRNVDSGISWDSEAVLLSEWINALKENKNLDNTIFIRTVCRRPDCKCAFRRHDTLVMFALIDTYLAHATWEKSLAGPRPRSQQPSNDTFSLPQQVKESRSCNTEVQASIMLFRQCRGWYEVLNENSEAIPHFTTVEQLRLSRPQTFLVRTNLKCLAAPEYLQQTAADPGSLIQMAQTPDTLASSMPCVVRAGTLFRFLEYLPNCVVRKGRRTRQLHLVLAVERNPNSHLSDKYIYFGIEEASKDAIFPPRLALSQVAGPENISGVHSMAGILRKFRLPISIRPVAVQETSSQESLLSTASPRTATMEAEHPMKFPLMPELIYTERHLMRLKSIFRGDILLLAAVDNPARFFIITPAMLKDHCFYFGRTTDPMYTSLLTAHRNRTNHFIGTAHRKESLDYLLQFMVETTRAPKDLHLPLDSTKLLSSAVDFCSSKMAIEIISRTGRDPRVGPECDLKGHQVDEIYEDIEDIYFYIRNGYYPTRRTTVPGPGRKYDTSEVQEKPRPSSSYAEQPNSKPFPPQQQATPGPLLRADQLLEASLRININSNNR
ncbi:hypothetical protein Ciccas_008627 [Cichlidogyrus casuarinus]|uniref:CABIT domain-containing protein n=1 Tax=Cichlidogyrus casuarinus TaxID=1844966 RepID=A0ABD2Q226_9PLAT